MNRRVLLGHLGGGISGTFLLGAVSGATAGATGTANLLKDTGSRQAKHSWAEHGEDLIIDSVCRYLGLSRPTYLDIGAAEPIVNSNTYLFYRAGCRGVLIEPNPSLCKLLTAVRPCDKTINAGIEFDGRSEADYYMVNGALMNTFSRDWIDAMAAKLGNRDFIENVVKMPLLNINEVIEKHFTGPPDFISVDTEGLDLYILTSLDFSRFRPPVVCAETGMIESKGVETRIIDLMRSHDYSVRGSTIQNAIFVDNGLLV
jgi:FkbM family methyltransferase